MSSGLSQEDWDKVYGKRMKQYSKYFKKVLKGEQMENLEGDTAKATENWMEIARQNQRNTDYYRDLVVQCGEAIGKKAYIQDDGGIVKDVLCAKVPELVREFIRSLPV